MEKTIYTLRKSFSYTDLPADVQTDVEEFIFNAYGDDADLDVVGMVVAGPDDDDYATADIFFLENGCSIGEVVHVEMYEEE